jgi:hypothetical protein
MCSAAKDVRSGPIADIEGNYSITSSHTSTYSEAELSGCSKIDNQFKLCRTDNW